MENNAKIAPVTAPNVQSSSLGEVAPVAPAAPARDEYRNTHANLPPVANSDGRYRLIIEEGPTRGSYIYKTLDRVTGEVIRQFPREQLVDLMGSPDYGAGSVIDTTI